MIGRTLGSYRITEQIGLGGMATVYKAFDAATDRYVAIKILPEHYSKDPTFRQRFEREAKAIARMEHIHILPIFTYGDEDGTAYLVMRYMQAGTLAELIEKGPLPFGEASRLLTQIASALDYAHKHGILHRDVKPSNVLIDAEGNAFLTDFGIAKMVEGTSDLTGSGLIGTPHYMSPEQCQGEKTLTPASDQYSLGVVLYEMLTGGKPYQAETPVAVILMQLNGPLPSPRSLRPDISEEMEAIIYKALAKQPEMRYSNCGAMAEAFAEAIQIIELHASIVPSKPKPGEAPVTSAIEGLDAEGTIRVAPPTRKEAPARRLPDWAIMLIGVLVVGGCILAAVIGGALPASPAAGPASTPTAAEMLGGATPASPGESPSQTPIPDKAPGLNSAVFAIEGVRHVAICPGPDPRQELCIEQAGATGKPIRIKTELELESAAWSPDGMQLTLTGWKAGTAGESPAHVFTLNLEDGKLHLVDENHSDVFAVWSPNGDWLAMHSDGTLAIIRPNGDGYRQLWKEKDECVSLPQWSPDSRKIIFSATECRETPPRRRVLMASMDGIITPIAEIPTQPGCGDPRAAFSPDGGFIAYLDEDCHAKLVTVDGSPTDQTLGDFNMMWTGEFFPQWGLKE